MSEEPETLPPHNVEAEQQVLGAILLNNDNLDRISGLQSEHFYEGLHARIFETAQSLVSAGKSASPVTMQTFFEAEEDIGTITVPQYIARLCTACVSTFSVRDYANTIRDLATRRELVALGQDMIECASNASPQFTPIDQITEAESRLYALAENDHKKAKESRIAEAMQDAIDLASMAHSSDGEVIGVPSGLFEFDKKMGGFQDTDLIVMAGRPAMGKSALMMNIVRHAAGNGVPVGVWSGEMSKGQLAVRMAASESKISGDKIRRGVTTKIELEYFNSAARDLGNLPIYIDESGGLNIAQLTMRARRMKRTHGIGLFCIDYIQLMSGSRKSFGNRTGEVTEITMGLKALAKDLGIPVIALSQLSRNVESREDKRPQLADLRESGSIEQDADSVVFVFREEYYLAQSKPEYSDLSKYQEWSAKMEPVRNKGEIIIAKNRHGPTGSVKVGFQGDLTQFSNLAEAA